MALERLFETNQRRLLCKSCSQTPRKKNEAHKDNGKASSRDEHTPLANKHNETEETDNTRKEKEDHCMMDDGRGLYLPGGWAADKTYRPAAQLNRARACHAADTAVRIGRDTKIETQYPKKMERKSVQRA